MIKRRAYKITYCGKDHRVNLVQKLYKELYDTRNDFLHGNPVKPKRLYPFRNKNVPHIIRFAPLIYKIALLSFLDRFKDRRKKIDWRELDISFLINERELSQAILKCKGT